jgi:ketosteroid isomerase-like protein
MVSDPNAALKLNQGGSLIAASGDLAVTTGSYEFTFTDPATGEPTAQHGMNQSVWQKQTDGAWKNVSDFNVALPEKEAL